jgi:L-alanine-DL-glutamate epimerase-like enolase superfamily enzyme
LWRTLARESGYAGAQPAIATYGSCGHFHPGADTQALRDELRAALDLGYRTVKIKVDGRDLAIDAPRIEAALAEVGQGRLLAIDANGHADVEAHGWLNAISAYGLAWIEEPVGPLDYAGLARFAQVYPGVIATGENLFSAADARNLLLYGGLRAGHDRIQVDMLLSYGLPEYRCVLDMYLREGWTRAAFWPHAGHLFAAHVVAGFGLGSHEAAPDATRLYGGFWDGTRIEDGHLRIPDIPGVGYEAKQNLYAVLRELVQ